ncbi:MAG TPA: M24 family metallopeptidase [Gemmatimonadaceae bacterium]
MTIQSASDLAGLQRAGHLVARTLAEMRGAVRPGITTAALDDVAARFARAEGARSAPQLAYDFPGFTCISVNDEIVHGIPGPRVLRGGDVVKLDVTLELDGYIADAAVTVLVPPAERSGHGVGRRIHESPSVPNFRDPGTRGVLTPGLVIALEPMITPCPTRAVERRDGWTVCTESGALAAHHEHTIVIRQGAPLVVTM